MLADIRERAEGDLSAVRPRGFRVKMTPRQPFFWLILAKWVGYVSRQATGQNPQINGTSPTVTKPTNRVKGKPIRTKSVNR